MAINKLFQGSAMAIALCCMCGVTGCVSQPEDEYFFVDNGVDMYDCDGSEECMAREVAPIKEEKPICRGDECFTEQFVKTYDVMLTEKNVAPQQAPQPRVLPVTEGDTLALSRPATARGQVVGAKEHVSEKTAAETATGVVYVQQEVPKIEKKEHRTETKTATVVVAQPKQVGNGSQTFVTEKVSSSVAPVQKTTTTTITEAVRRTDAQRSNMSGVIQESVGYQSEQTILQRKVVYGEQIHDWEALSGETLRSLLMAWSEQSGWTVAWKLDRDYHLEAGVVFRGTFKDAAGALVRSFARATPAPIGTFYQGNRVLVISTQEDENER